MVNGHHRRTDKPGYQASSLFVRSNYPDALLLPEQLENGHDEQDHQQHADDPAQPHHATHA